MAILGIESRTENWKTAKTFAPLIEDADLRLKLVEKLGEPVGTSPDDVELELFWYGIRDFLNKRDVDREDIKNHYTSLFSDLRRKVEKFPRLQTPNDWNYRVSRFAKLYNNLRNTEIDVVLETPNLLFIGEAKNESKLVGNGDLVLVHQLIRQYVTARILVDLLGCDKEVISFIVADKVRSIRNTRQVAFIVQQGWLKQENILSWDDIPG